MKFLRTVSFFIKPLFIIFFFSCDAGANDSKTDYEDIPQIEYKIVWNLNGGYWENDLDIAQSYSSNSDFILPINLYKEGYLFSGWYDNENFTGKIIDTIPAGTYEDKTFYAKWSDEIYCDVNSLKTLLKKCSEDIFTVHITDINPNISVLTDALENVSAHLNLDLYLCSGLLRIERYSFLNCNCINNLILPESLLFIESGFNSSVETITILKDGQIQQSDNYLYMYNHPINKFVAGFIGSPQMNFITVTIKKSGEKIVADGGSFEIIPTEEQQAALKDYVGKEVYFGVRPEDLAYCDAPAAENNMQLKISNKDVLGVETHLFFTINGNNIIARVHASTKGDFKVGEIVNFQPAIARCKFFVKNSEKPEEEINICEKIKTPWLDNN